MSRTQTRYVCQSCGSESPKWLGRCPDCGAWASFQEEIVESAGRRETNSLGVTSLAPPASVRSVSTQSGARITTGISEFDRVLGGGVVPGSLILIGGDPGIGKSTLLTQVAHNLSAAAGPTLYVSGEESVEQIKLRCDRLGANAEGLLLATETSIEAVQAYIESSSPRFVVIDSIQTMYHPSLYSAPGTVSQVRNCTSVLARIAKSTGIPIFIVGHVTKAGALAGPRVLEHMVDTVLYFEGDRHLTYRILRAVKNRFGSTDELGIFEMHEDGLSEVASPSEVLLLERPADGAGSVVTSTIEGTRPLLVEIQALVAQSYFVSPRRMVTGVDHNRTLMILAVLEKRAGMRLGDKDIYVNVAGGVRVVEPAVDLAIAMAVASSARDRPVNPKAVILGEVGLAGEIRAVSQIENRLREAARVGFTTAILCDRNAKRIKGSLGLEPVGIRTVHEALDASLMVIDD